MSSRLPKLTRQLLTVDLSTSCSCGCDFPRAVEVLWENVRFGMELCQTTDDSYEISLSLSMDGQDGGK